MPGGSFIKAYVKCPFYLTDDGVRRVTCEGVVDGNNLTSCFVQKADYEVQMNVFCCQRYENCEIYRMLMENKYEEE